ncbi:extracellular solute-binding protein [Kiloniella laminariae]|uniref:extracellular solute-binding protein n=1 Tax=Kiloniella laminariae TaxID=454162 RepID=UPI000373FBD6|nr:extracellular solute-binding protein [Kiloniella laminariae]
MRSFILVSFVLSAFLPLSALAETTQKSHGIAIHGEPGYPADFTHFNYVNPAAPKGGELRLASEGTFDSFNPYIIKGVAGPGFQPEALLAASADEAASEYGLIAESLEWPENRAWVTFTLRPEARWHDGQPITVEDVIFSLETISTKADPYVQNAFAIIKSVEKVGDRQVRFYSAEIGNREFPITAGSLPILAKHYWESRDFAKSTLEPPLQSGPYRIKDFEAGRYVIQERVKDYWGKDLPVNRGQDNFDSIRTTYYQDDDVIKLAIKSGEIDYRNERSSSAWAQDYDVPAIAKGWLKKESIPHKRPQGIQGFFLNTRREIFKDPKVREALGYVYDFEWSNKALSFGLLTRSTNFFGNSVLASTGLPEGRELEILEQYKDQLPERLFTDPFTIPTTDGMGWPRDNFRKAFILLEEAGWIVRDLKLVNAQTGEQMTFEMLLASKGMERTVLPFVNNLRQLGIDVRTRLVDQSQYYNRISDFDFDIVIIKLSASISPGTEQRGFWTSETADRKGSGNFSGIHDPAIDALVERVVSAKDREDLVASVRALDRALLWGFYVIPQFHTEDDRVLYWDKFSRPEITPWRGTSTAYWWFDQEKAEALATNMARNRLSEDNKDGTETAAPETISEPLFNPAIIDAFLAGLEELGLPPEKVRGFFTFQLFTDPEAFFQKDNWRPYALTATLLLLLLLARRRRRNRVEEN